MDDVSYFMTYYRHYFVVCHQVHQSGTDTYATVTTGKCIYIYYFINAEIYFQSVYLFYIAYQFFKPFAVFTIWCSQWVVGIHPLHIFLTHSGYVSIRQGDGFYGIGSGLYNFAYIDFFSSDLKLSRSTKTYSTDQCSH